MNYQKKRWGQFFQTEIYQVFEDYFKNYEHNGIEISAEPDPSQITALQRQKLYGVQEKAPLYVSFTLKNKNNRSEAAVIKYPAIKLLDIPLYAEDGFKAKTSTVKPVSRLEYASGWYISDFDKSFCTSRLIYHNKYGRVFSIANNGYVYANSTHGVPVLHFLKAVTGYSFDELQMFYKDIPGFINYVFATEEVSYEDCCYETLQMLREGRNCELGTVVTDLNNLLFEYVPGRAGDEKIPRYLEMESFHRCHGMRVKSIKGTDEVKIGTVITSEIAEKMDKVLVIPECTLTDGRGKDYTIKRCYAEGFNRNLTPKEILYAYYQYLLYLNGIGEKHDEQELSNLILEPIDKVAKRCIELALNRAVGEIITNINHDKLNPVAGLDKIFNNLSDKDKTQFDIITHISDSNSNRTVDITNTISEVDLSGKVKRQNSNAQRDVHGSHYGRIDMNDTPESEEVGLTISLCVHSDIDRYGFITVPLYRVIDGKVDKTETVYLSYLEEKWQYIAPVGINLDEYKADDLIPNCTLNGEPVSAVKKLITYQRRQSEDFYGSTLNAVPGVTWNGIKRYTLASSGFKQACPLLKPERPYLSTGFNKNDAGVVRTRDIIEEFFATRGMYNIEIPKDITIKLRDLNPENNTVEAVFELSEPIEGVEVVKYLTLGVSRSMSNTMRQYKLAHSDKNYHYKYDDIVFHSNDVLVDKRDTELVAGSFANTQDTEHIADHDIALGQNLRVLFKTFEGFGYEDSVQLNRRFVDKFGLANIYTITVSADNSRKSDKDRKMVFTNAISNPNKNIKPVDWLDEKGLPRIGTYLKPGDIVIGRALVDEYDSGKTIPKPIKLTVNQEGYVWFADKSKVHDNNGTYDRVEVTLAKIIPLDVGDKVTGGHGNKATCSRILEEHEMPFFEDGTTPDIIFDPLGCIARENVGQITECLLAEIGRQKDKTMVINHGTPINPDQLMVEADECGISQHTLYNPKTGEPYKEKAFIGTMHIVRSTHTCFSKYMAMGTSKGKTSINFQPTREGAEHAQRISEMTTWCYHASGASEVLNSLFAAQSDDLKSHSEMAHAIESGMEYDGDYESINGYRLQAYLRVFGMNMTIDDNHNTFLEPINSEKALELSGHNVVNTNGPKDKDTLSNPEIFGDSEIKATSLRENLQKYGLIKIPKEIISPIFLSSSEFTGCIPTFKVLKPDCECSDSTTGKRILSGVFEGLKPSEIQKIFKDELYFGTISEPITVLIDDSAKLSINKVFVLFKNPNYALKLKCYNADKGGNNFFDVIGNEELYDLNGALEIYRSVYNNNTIKDDIVMDKAANDRYDHAMRAMSKSEDAIFFEDDNDIENAADRYSPAELSSMLTGYKPDHMRLEEMLQVTKYTLKSFMSQYVMVPPMILRPVTNDHGTYRAFSKVLSSVLANSTGDVMTIYKILATELKPNKNKKKNAQGKTLITELTSHKNKTSVIRDSILAKPVSYSGRSVISVDPTLNLGECKVPALMLVTIFMEHLLELIHTKNDSLIYNRVTANDTRRYNKGTAREFINGIVTGDLDSSVGALNIIDDYPLNVEKSVKLSISSKLVEFNKVKKELYEMLSDLSERYPVILSRDPALWLLSVRGHKFIPSEGYTIRIHPLVCMGFNADFDGDQMSAIFPMHKHAREVLGETAMVGSTLINPQDGSACFAFEQDILMGHFFATKEEPDKSGILNGTLNNISDIITLTGNGEFVDRYKYSEILSLYDKIDIGQRSYSDTVIVNYNNHKYVSTVGRLMFNLLYPMDYVFQENIDENGLSELRFGQISRATSKEFTKWVISMQAEYVDQPKEDITDLFKNQYGLSGEVMRVADRLMSFGFAAADLSGTTLSYWDFANLRDKRIDDKIVNSTKEAQMITTRKRLGLLDEEMAKARLRDIWGETQKFSEEILGRNLNINPNLYNIIRSGARGSVTNLNHICGFIGTVINNHGEELPEPIKGNYLCGLTNEEVSINAFDGRRIKLQTQGGSSIQGEKTRKLVYLLEHFRTHKNENSSVCDTKPTRLKLNYILDESKLPSNSDGAIIYSIEPTDDMSLDESNKWKNFIAELIRLGLPKCPGEYANKSMFDLGLDVAAIEGINTKVELKWKLQREHRNMLWYRTLAPETLAPSVQNRILTLCIEDTSLDMQNYILTHDAIDVIEKNKLPTIDFYTMIGCNNSDGTICPRCYGYRYEDCKYPQDNEQIGYTVAGVIGQRGLQGAQNLHKSGGGVSSKNINIYSGNSAFALTSPSKLNSKAVMIPKEEIVNYYKDAIADTNFKFPLCFYDIEGEEKTTLKYYRSMLNGVEIEEDFVNKADDDFGVFEGFSNPSVDGCITKTFETEVAMFMQMLSSVARNAGEVNIHNLNKTLVISVYDNTTDKLTWFPLWNQAIKIAVTAGQIIDKGTPLIELPTMSDLIEVNNTSVGEDLQKSQRELAMQMWYTVLKTMTSGGDFAARNFELTTKAFNEIGMALEPDYEKGIVVGRLYPTYKLNNAGVQYKAVIPSDFHLLSAREKVYAALAKGHFAVKACSFCVRKIISEPLSGISDEVVGIDRANNSYPKMIPQVASVHNDMSKIINSVIAGKTAHVLEVKQPKQNAIEIKNIEATVEEKEPTTKPEVTQDKIIRHENVETFNEDIEDKNITTAKAKDAFDDIDEFLEESNKGYPAKRKNKKKSGHNSTTYFDD